MMELLTKKLNNRKGFTLIELIVVIAIIGILAAILIPQFGGFTDKARATEVIVAAKSVGTAIDGFHVENGAYPVLATDLTEIETTSGVDGAGGTPKITAMVSDGTFIVTFALPDGTNVTAGRTISGSALSRVEMN